MDRFATPSPWYGVKIQKAESMSEQKYATHRDGTPVTVASHPLRYRSILHQALLPERFDLENRKTGRLTHSWLYTSTNFTFHLPLVIK